MAHPKGIKLKKLTPDDHKINSLLVIPDAQNAPEHPTEHLVALSNWIVANQPEWIVDLGDWNDHVAAGRWESDAEKAAAGRDIMADLEHAMYCNDLTYGPAFERNKRLRKNKRYTPKIHRCKGNHEVRPETLCNKAPWLEGLIFNPKNYNEDKYGIQVHEFLEIISIAGVWFSHYFPQSSDGNVKQTRSGQSNARLQVQRLMNSAVAGHMQGLSTHVHTTPARRVRGIIAGSFYLHDEGYMGPDGNNYWRGVLHLKQVKNGEFSLSEIPMEELLRDWL